MKLTAHAFARIVIVGAGLFGAIAIGCGGGGDGNAGGGGAGGGASGTPCEEHPLACPAGETCWFAGGTSLTCQTSGAGKSGETCAPTIGIPTCGDGLLCVRGGGADEAGACIPLCDPSAPDATCAEGVLCRLVTTEEGAETHVCDPAAFGG